MFLDASVIVAILAKEEDAGYFLAKIEAHKKQFYYSAMSAFEAVVSLGKILALSHGLQNKPTPPELLETAQRHVEAFFEMIGARPMVIDGNVYKVALEAARRFGRHVGHPARLNMGDCFAYACAKQYRIPLLFKGDDFPHTDIESV
ncbi:PIN domain-containing protein [Agrobacterium vitis]|uniref:PIN domain-containing protein n=1 Tax=Agrobacterium vitis TaxID=373 RepID=A0A6L6VRJ2_AGRVI|nr:type II toxin-antitoxin system VapC family toxin [Agrobacterium vitis]MUZ76092.1 PIN domain-containing protein [Agrobacterium vitis]